MKNKGYNGHKNRAHWNVSLWIGNDEGLYRMALDYIRRCDNKREAAEHILNHLQQCGKVQTPDGYRYNVTNIRAAIVGM
jgi:hypothetical protein